MKNFFKNFLLFVFIDWSRIRLPKHSCFYFNRNAKLEVNDSILIASYGWDRHISVSLSEIIDADAFGKSLVIWTAEHQYSITGLLNTADIGRYILMRITRVIWLKDIDSIKTKLKAINKKCIWLSVATISTVVVLFQNIAICVLLTENAEISEFNNQQNKVFLLFAFSEMITVILCFFLYVRAL